MPPVQLAGKLIQSKSGEKTSINRPGTDRFFQQFPAPVMGSLSPHNPNSYINLLLLTGLKIFTGQWVVLQKLSYISSEIFNQDTCS